MNVGKKMVGVGLSRFMGFAVGVIGCAAMVTGVGAQSFQISQNGTKVGTASLLVKESGVGFSATSGAKISMPDLNYSFSETETLDKVYQLKSAQLNGSVNGTSAKVGVELQGQQLLMKISANNSVNTSPLTFHAEAVMVPDFDPGSLQIMLNLAALHNNRGLWAVVPKQTGSVAAIQIVTKRDEEGTLDGKPTLVHHLSVTFASDAVEVFSGSSNQLLQAEWTSEGFAMVRQGFVLTPSTRPTAPPPAAQQPASGQGAGQGAGQAPQS